MFKSEEHYSGTLLASWALQEALNDYEPTFWDYQMEEAWPPDYAELMNFSRFLSSGELKQVRQFMTSNPCFQDDQDDLKRFNNLNKAFPCSGMRSPHDGDAFHPEVLDLLRDVYDEATISSFDQRFKAFRFGTLTLSFVCGFVRDVMDDFMRKHFEDRGDEMRVLKEFSNEFGTSQVVKRRIVDNTNGLLFDVYVLRTRPTDDRYVDEVGDKAFDNQPYESVMLVEQAGKAATELDVTAAAMHLMYCFVPAGLYTCKPLEYKKQVGVSGTHAVPFKYDDDDEYFSYLYIGRYLHGVFPANGREREVKIRTFRQIKQEQQQQQEEAAKLQQEMQEKQEALDKSGHLLNLNSSVNATVPAPSQGAPKIQIKLF